MMNATKLLAPITRGTETIAEVGLRKPDVGSLRGLKMTDILQMDVNSMMVLLPRLTEPALLPVEVASLEPADFMTLSGRVVSFFLTPEQKSQVEAMEPRH